MCSCLEDLMAATVQFLILPNFLVFFLHQGVHNVAGDNLEDYETSHEDTQVAGSEDQEDIRGKTSSDSLDENNTCSWHFVSPPPILNYRKFSILIQRYGKYLENYSLKLSKCDEMHQLIIQISAKGLRSTSVNPQNPQL